MINCLAGDFARIDVCTFMFLPSALVCPGSAFRVSVAWLVRIEHGINEVPSRESRVDCVVRNCLSLIKSNPCSGYVVLSAHCNHDTR